MKDKLVGIRVVAAVAAVFALVGISRVSPADGPSHVAEQNFLGKATVAMKAVQAIVKDDKILIPLAKGKIEHGDDYLMIRTPTSEKWPNFPAKPQNLKIGYGWLRIDIYASRPERSPGTPFIPPPGCYWHRPNLSCLTVRPGSWLNPRQAMPRHRADWLR